MALPMRRAIGDVVGSIICLGVVLAALITVDGRVRQRVSLLFTEAAGNRGESWGRRIEEVAGIVMQAARDQSIENAPLLLFTVTAAVLVIFMLRT